MPLIIFTVYLSSVMASFFSVPKPLVAFNSKFPLKTYPPIRPTTKNPLTGPTLWIAPPKDGNLSNDVECLKWQAYLALRGVKGVQLRYDVAPEGSLDGVLPNLHVPLAESPLKNVPEVGRPDENGELLPTHGIPGWVDAELGVDSAADPLEGYVNEAARVESRAWVSLLEGVVHAALVRVHSMPLSRQSLPPLTVLNAFRSCPNHNLRYSTLYYSLLRNRRTVTACRRSCRRPRPR